MLGVKFLMCVKLIAVLCFCIGLMGCATKHPDCERADVFGHCKKWEGYENPCPNPDFLGFCPPSRQPN